MLTFIKKYGGYALAALVGLLTYFKIRDKSNKDEPATEFINKKILEKEKHLQDLAVKKSKPVEELSPEEVKDYWKH